MNPIYIHHGSTHFDPAKFTPICNSEWQPKPEGGLWGSRIDAEYGWEQWSISNDYNLGALERSFRFTISSSRILVIESTAQLEQLPKLHPWESDSTNWLNGIMADGKITMDQLYTPQWCYLDYEKISESYDAIEIREPWNFRDAFPTWDCDSVVVLNSGVVVEV